MRNYRELSEGELSELERLYPVTTNRELSRMFDISVDAIQDYVAYPRGWKKDLKAVRVGNRHGHSLTEKELKWVIGHYGHTKNKDIVRKFGICESQLHRVARRYNLKKTRQFMRKSQRTNAEQGRMVCVRFGIYEESGMALRQRWAEYKARGEYAPGSFLPGVSNKDRLSPRRFSEAMRKAQAKRNESIRKDRMRIRWGLPQKTRMKLVSGGHKRACYKHLLKKKGYIVDRTNVIYYDSQTNRSEKMEATAFKFGLRVYQKEN